MFAHAICMHEPSECVHVCVRMYLYLYTFSHSLRSCVHVCLCVHVFTLAALVCVFMRSVWVEMSVLVLGGSCFMGKLLVERLRADSLDVVTVNRGRRYWGVPGCPSVCADRRDRETYSSAIRQLLPTRAWLCVVDFCAYKRQDISRLPKELFEICYILISTDSVYECVSSALPDPVVEDCLVNMIKRRDKYGYNKWRCEQALCERGRGLVLRLPDVLGEFDDTLRFWSLVEQASTCSDSVTLVSFVYSRDVVEFILCAIRRELPCTVTVVNLLCDQQPSMHEFLQLVRAHEIHATTHCADACTRATTHTGACTDETRATTHADACKFFPSVEYRKNPLSGKLAREQFGFVPTHLQTVVDNTLRWISQARLDFPNEYAEARGL